MFGRGEAERSLSPSREFPLQLQLISAPWIKGWNTESAARIAELRYIDPFTVLIISGHSGCRGMTFRDRDHCTVPKSANILLTHMKKRLCVSKCLMSI